MVQTAGMIGLVSFCLALAPSTRAQDADGAAPVSETVARQDDDAGVEDDLTPDQLADFELWKSGLIESTNSVARQTAATKLLESAWPESYALLTDLLVNSDRSEVVLAIADALTELPAAPPLPLGLLTPLLDAYRQSAPLGRESIEFAVTRYPAAAAIPLIISDLHNPEAALSERIALIDLISQFVEVETVDALIPCLKEDQPTKIRAATQGALESITGVTGMGDSNLRWESWWNRNRADGREGLLAANLKRLQNEIKARRPRDREQQEERAELLKKLITSIEKQYALSPVDRRSPLLVELLEDRLAPIRSLGMRLIEQAMSNGEQVSAEVEVAVAARIDDAVPTIRADAIGRLTFINGQSASDRAAARLPIEDQFAVRSKIYNTLELYPSAQAAIPLIERYTTVPGQEALQPAERGQIAQALAASCRAGYCSDEAIRNDVATVLLNGIGDVTDLAVIRQAVQPAELELLAWSGLPESQAICALILATATDVEDLPREVVEALGPIREAVARGLAASGLADEALFAAGGDAQIHPMAIGALRARLAGIEVLQIILTNFATPSTDVQHADVVAIMAELPLQDWLAADDALLAAEAEIGITLEQRAAWLRRIFNPVHAATNNGNGTSTAADNDEESTTAVENQPVSESNGAGLIRRAICLRLAGLELDSGSATAALDALRAAPHDEADEELFVHLRTVALIVSGEYAALDETAALLTPVWLAALDVLDRLVPGDAAEEAARQDQRQYVAAKIQELGGEELSDADRDRITAVLAVVDDPLDSETPPAGVGPGGDQKAGSEEDDGGDDQSEGGEDDGSGGG